MLVYLDAPLWDQSLADCVAAPARRELARTSSYGKPRPRRAFLLPTKENIGPGEHTSLLSKYLQVALFLVSRQCEMATPILRHPDLSFPNILLSPGTNKIEGVIDWQDASILPLFIQAGYPAFCEHNISQVQSLREPTSPENYEELNEVDRMKVDIKLHLEKANLYYYAATGLENGLHLRALRLPGIWMIQYLISHAGYPWDADLINLKAALVGLTKIWDGIISDPCPISFFPKDEKTILNDAAEWRECEEILLNIQENIGIEKAARIQMILNMLLIWHTGFGYRYIPTLKSNLESCFGNLGYSRMIVTTLLPLYSDLKVLTSTYSPLYDNIQKTDPKGNKRNSSGAVTLNAPVVK
ncbi:phosphotransferase enzyme family protein [Nannizzia gypsea CBS 118893]|uniref:Phosphotransferase enzyme family protein n=1 Tax=Arthroderma gypseum (strain ATCC MYA-4604 / CBS 118893) TaxID=535722 RepID=E4UXJ5_ARTGP|nr:phosphotransferase enzyme family protein [Nannizzia gypsea CBS 118893]EFR02729.1 phosphotransferase enzyme family protein [Nannizzia gypsea CBS 118893]